MDKKKVVVKLVATDGNVFAIIGKVSGALKKAGLADEAKAYTAACFGAGSYDEVLRITLAAVEVR